MKSLLSNDRRARTEGHKKLFGCRRKMVVSDSTVARVLGWVRITQVRAFLLGFLDTFERKDLLRKRLCLGGKREGGSDGRTWAANGW
jgi:hypothetical protein